MVRVLLMLLGAASLVLLGLPTLKFDARALPLGGRPPASPPPTSPPPTSPPPVSTADTITLSNPGGAAISNYPLQFGRPFIDGAIATAPQVVAGGSALLTQADVKERYADGSVKFAVVAVVIPAIPAGGSLSLTFRNQSAPPNTPLSQAQMLGSGFNFDAVLRVAGAGGGAAQSVSARTMLANGDYTLWTSGPVAQTIMLGDDSARRRYDLGFGDGYHPLRPRFYATFWPALGKVFVRVVAENDLASELEDLTYSATVSLGSTAPAPVYSVNLTGTQTTNPKEHWAMTAWTKTFWLGAAPPLAVDIDNNLAYLASTRFIPNFDPAIAASAVLPTQTIGDVYDAIWDGFLMQSAMSVSGEHAEIGPYPQWYVQALYPPGDYRLRQLMLNVADQAGNFPGQLRETVGAKRLSRADAAGTSTGLGRTISITDRTTFTSAQLTYGYTAAGDKANIVGTVAGVTSGTAQPPWSFDGAHQPSFFYVPYLLTGDPWYLQEMYLWAGFSAARYNGGTGVYAYQRGPTGAEGGIDDQLRGAGWVLRNRAETAFIAPDADPEKAYFTYLTNDALARWEGSLAITGTPYDGQPEKVWGAKTGNFFTGNGGPVNGQVTPLGNWESNGYPNGKDPTVTGNVAAGVFAARSDGAPVAGTFTSPWMEWFKDYGLARAAELGFAAGPLLAKTAPFAIGMVLDSGYPEMIGSYQMPVEANAVAPGATALTVPPGGFFTSWAALKSGFAPAFLTGAGWNPANNGGEGDLAQFWSNRVIDGNDSYPNWPQPIFAAFVDEGQPRAATAWAWYAANLYRAPGTASFYAGNQRWAVVPRTDANKLPAQPTATPPS